MKPPRLGRLALKLLLLLLLMAGVPLLVAFGLSSTLFERSLGAGLNPSVSAALEDAVTVFGERLQAEKGRQRAVAAGLAESEALRSALRAGDLAGVEALLSEALSVPLATAIELVPRDPARTPPLRRSNPPPAGWLSETLTLPLPADTGYRTLAYTYGMDPEYLARFQRMETEVIHPFNALEADRERRASLYTWSFVATLGAAILGACGIALVAGGRITTRIYRLRRAMAEVAAGRWETRLRPSGHDEVTELMAGFNHMATQLEESRARIEYLTQVSAWQGIARRMAHEIKNPLTPILLSVQQAQSAYKGDDPDHRRTLGLMRGIVEQEVHTLRRLVDAFSTFAQMPQLQRAQADLAALCREVAAAHPEIPGLAVRVPEEPVPASVDADLLRQALTNLLNNAAQALAARPPAESPRVELSCERRGDDLLLSVTDNGPGVAPEQAARIFEPYVTGRPDGTGLGLAIVKRVILDHGGAVEVQPGPGGVGARFLVTLPSSPDAPGNAGSAAAGGLT